MSRTRSNRRSSGFGPPCLPTKAPQPPTGEAWLHEIKHDGFRAVARKDGDRVRLYIRPTQDLMSSPKLPWKRNMPASRRARSKKLTFFYFGVGTSTVYFDAILLYVGLIAIT